MKSYGSDLPNITEIEESLERIVKNKTDSLHREINKEVTGINDLKTIASQNQDLVTALIMENTINLNKKLDSIKHVAVVNCILLIFNLLGIGGWWVALYLMFIRNAAL